MASGSPRTLINPNSVKSDKCRSENPINGLGPKNAQLNACSYADCGKDGNEYFSLVNRGMCP